MTDCTEKLNEDLKAVYECANKIEELEKDLKFEKEHLKMLIIRVGSKIEDSQC